MTPCQTRSPATMSYSLPGCARRTRMRCDACSPVSDAVLSSQLSAIHLRRVMDFYCRRKEKYRRNTKGDAICVPRGVALFLCLLLLCSFLCCLLRWLLCCFLGCHSFLFSLFVYCNDKCCS